MRKILLSNKKDVVMVDDNEFERLSRHKWNMKKSLYMNYAQTHVKKGGKTMSLFIHRLIMNAESGQEIDHINGDGLDNRKENLRFCTKSQNQMNKRRQKNAGSKYRGVSWDKQYNKWRALIGWKGKIISLGRFDDIDDAAKAYNAKALGLAGEFATLNTISRLLRR